MSVKSVVEFSIRMLSLINGKEEEAVIFSPSSILNSLAMVLAGAKGETAQQILEILGKEKSMEEVIKYFSDQMKNHETPKNHEIKEGEVQINYANRLFLSQNASLIPEFVNLMNESFNGQIQQLDFGDSGEATKEINKFVAEATKGKIPEIIEKNTLGKRTCLALVNALYFCGRWENVFQKRFKLPFYQTLLSTREIEVASQIITDEKWNISDSDEWECLGIPYQEHQTWMYIVLPKEKDRLAKIIEKLDYSMFLEFTKFGKTGFMQIRIPIFEAAGSYILNDILKKLGMTEAFGGRCDLSGMMTSKNGMIDEIIHKATINVDQFGTEATAATVCKAYPKNGPRYFTADHPFFYFIATQNNNNQKLNEILFVGTFC